ncbi:MAG TPA: hypothetical protein VF798_11970 [Burkholderiaceae bacterium]
MLRDRIATDAALFDVETKCGEPDENGWFSLASISDMDVLRLVIESVEFLGAIGRLEHHPIHPNLVKPRYAATLPLTSSERTKSASHSFIDQAPPRFLS